MGGWLIADPAGNVTAHRGRFVGRGGPWQLANAIVPGSAHAVESPVLTGYYRDRPEAYRRLTANREASLLEERGFPHALRFPAAEYLRRYKRPKLTYATKSEVE